MRWCWYLSFLLYLISCTSHHQGLGLECILEADHQGLSEGIDHGEDHPDLDQLDVGGARKGLADPKKAEEHWKFSSFFLNQLEENLQGGYNKHDGQIDFNDHVKVLLCEPACIFLLFLFPSHFFSSISLRTYSPSGSKRSTLQWAGSPGIQKWKCSYCLIFSGFPHRQKFGE